MGNFEEDPFKEIDIFKNDIEIDDSFYIDKIFMRTDEGSREFTLLCYDGLIRRGYSPEEAMKKSLYEKDEFFD